MTRNRLAHRFARALRARSAWIVLAAVAGLAGCSGIDPPNNDLLTSSIATGTPRKRVCVISAIGDTYSVQRIGVTVFGNALDKFPIDAWGIDGVVVSKISAQLGQRFDVRRIDYPKGAFASLEQEKSPFSSDARDYRHDIRDIARSISASHRCDLCIVVTKSGSMYSNTNQAVAGLGILDNSNLLVEGVFVFAIWEVRVYDAKTFQVLAHKRAPREQGFMAVIRGPHRKVDKTWLPAPGQVAQNPKLKQATLELVGQSIEPVVAELFAAQ